MTCVDTKDNTKTEVIFKRAQELHQPYQDLLNIMTEKGGISETV